jgi:hypothetical protein
MPRLTKEEEKRVKAVVRKANALIGRLGVNDRCEGDSNFEGASAVIEARYNPDRNTVEIGDDAYRRGFRLHTPKDPAGANLWPRVEAHIYQVSEEFRKIFEGAPREPEPEGGASPAPLPASRRRP